MKLTQQVPVLIVLLVVLLGGVPLSIACAQEQQTDTSSEVARVGDRVVTLKDVDDAWNRDDAIGRIRVLQQVYDARRRALDLVIGDYLIEREAASRGITTDELLDVELDSRMLPITDREVQLIYERNREVVGNRALEEVRPEIVAAIEQQRPNQALRQYMQELRENAGDIVLTLASLDPPRQKIEVLPGDPVRGPIDAPILLVEFSDFQCPFCQRAAETLEELFDRYEGKIRFAYKDYPLPNHPEAFKAAEAGNCAEEQGRFWEFHDKMFANQDALDLVSLKTYAEELDLDVNAFSNCLEEGRYAEKVQEDLLIGQGLGVSSTPTVFINGRLVLGAVPLEHFDEIIREELSIGSED